ncbi:MAG TPA: hypothetical protein VIH99_05555 [Bdellovibrionota bacterium]
MKKSLFALFALACLPLLQGCDVAVGVYDYGYNDYGNVGWYAPGYYHHQHHYHGGNHSWGRPGHHGGGWGHGGGRHGGGHHHAIDLADAAVEISAQANSPAALLAQDYGISEASALKIMALAKGEGRQETLDLLKLTSDELAVIARLDIPAPSTMRKIAAALGEDSDSISRLIKDFISDLRALRDAQQGEQTNCLNQFSCQN